MDLGQLCGRYGSGRKSAQQKTLRRAFKGALQQVTRDLLLSLRLGQRRFIDMRSETFAPDEQTFLCHQLHLLHCGGVTSSFAEFVVHIPDGSGAKAPNHRKNIELGGRRKGKVLGALQMKIAAYFSQSTAKKIACQR